MGASSTGRIAVLDGFRELRAVVSGEQGKNYVLPRPVGGSSMKTLPRIFAFVVLAVIVIVAVISCYRARTLVPNQKFLLYIGTKTISKTTYVEWTTEDEFDEALKQVCQHGGTYEIRKLKADGEKPYDAKPCIEIIKTVKVTKSKVADDAAAGAPAANDPNALHKIAAAKAEDITKVLSALK
jgi:hypothetical protein